MSLYKLLTPQGFVELTKTATKRIVTIDSTWYLPNLGKDGKKEYLELERIPGAVYFDIDGIKDTKSPYPHMAPDITTFNHGMSQLGLQNDDILVVYDRIGNFSGPRCAWTLALFGHSPVYLLNNFNVYKDLGLPLDHTKKTEFTSYPKSEYQATNFLGDRQVVPYEEILRLVETGEIKNYNFFDARALPRFEGKAPEPRPDIPSGHVPGAQPLPFNELLDEKTKQFPETQEQMELKLKEAWEKLGDVYDPKKKTICMCGTGVTGCIIKTALEHAGIEGVKLYDGSWVEWNLRSQSPLIAKNRD